MSTAEKAVRGAAWTIGASLAARLTGIVSTLLITRYLEPELIGEVTAAAIVVVSVNLLSNFGLGNYAVAKADDGPDVTFVSNLVYMVIGIFALSAVLIWGHHFSDLVNAPNMAEYIPGLVLSTFIRRIGHVPDKVLARELRFGPIGISMAVGELSYAIFSVGLAMAGWGGHAIVWANVIQSTIMTGIVISQVSWRSWLLPYKVRWERLKDQARFGVPLGLVATAHYASTTWDNLLYSRFFGPGQMGLYNLGYNLAAVPAAQIGDQVASVLFPSMSKVDGESRRRALVRSTSLMGLLVFPLGMGLFAISDTLIATLLNEKWQGVAPILAALSLITIVQPIGWSAGSYLMAQRKNWALSVQEFTKLATLAGGVAIFAPYGTVWACAGVALAFIVQSAIFFYILTKDGVPAWPLWHAMTRPLLPCLPMVASVFGVRWLLHSFHIQAPIIFLIVEIVVGALVFIPSAFLLAKPIAKDFLGLIKSALGRG